MKTAQRMAYFAIAMDEDDLFDLANALISVKRDLCECSLCGCWSVQKRCEICQDVNRNERVICVVQESKNVMMMERTGQYKGRYHVLHGTISPMNGIGPDDLNIRTLIERIKQEGIEEVILATNPNVEGEATAMYLVRLLQPLDVTMTRIAHGIPVGSDLDYADEVTLMKAMEGRREVGVLR